MSNYFQELQNLPSLVPGSLEDQAYNINSLLQFADKRGKKYIWYQPPSGIYINIKVKELLEKKGYFVKEQTFYRVEWTSEGAMKREARRKYFIAATTGRNITYL